jgi:hypothetical protein
MLIVFYHSIAIVSLQISVVAAAAGEERGYSLVEQFQTLAFWALAVTQYCMAYG